MKFRPFILLVLSFLFCFPSFGETEDNLKHPDDRWYSASRPDYTELDERVKSLAKDAASPEEVVKIVCHDLQTDIEKARAIFDWLAYNIAYDTSFKIYHEDEAFKKRRSVCQGYAELFDTMAEEAGLDSVMITGTANGGASIGKGGHAWNLVRLEERDLLLDCCWGAGYVSGKKFTRAFDPSWFDPHPAVFIYTHYPNDEAYACVTPILPKSLFNKMSHVKVNNFIPYGKLDPVDNYIARLNLNSEFIPVSTSSSRLRKYCYEYISTGKDLTDGFFILNREVLCTEISEFLKEDLYSYNETSLYQNKYSAASGLSLKVIAEYCNAISLSNNFEQCYQIEGDQVICDFTKDGYRIPTKKEWLLAFNSLDFSKKASSPEFTFTSWYKENCGGKIREVCQTRANENMLYDMSGNVNEICWDEAENQYVLLGGSIYDSKEKLLSLEAIPYTEEILKEGANGGLRLVYRAPHNAHNQYEIAMKYHTGKLLQKNDDLYIQWLDLAIKNGDPYAMAERASTYYKLKTDEGYKKCYELAKAAAEAEQHYGLYLLGIMYEYGRYVEKDPLKSFEYYERSAQAGNLAGMYETATAYKNAKVVEYDADKIFYWLKRCIDGGSTNEDAKIDLALCYKYGKGCEKNERQSYKMLLECANNKEASIRSLVEFADCLAEGSGSRVDWASAIVYYKRAEAKGSIYAKAKLADCAFNACGMKRNLKEAVLKYKEIIDAGFGPTYQEVYDLYYSNLNLMNNYQNNGEFFLSSIPKETSPAPYIDALTDLSIEATLISGAFFNCSELLAGIPEAVIRDKMVKPLHTINDNQELKGKTLIILSPREDAGASKLKSHILSTNSFTQTKYRVNGEYYNNDEAFYNHYDNILFLGNDSEADKSLSQIFSSIKPYLQNCSELDFMFFETDIFTDTDFIKTYKELAESIIDKGLVTRLICFGNKTDSVQLEINKYFEEKYLSKINVFGTPANMQAQLSCAFRKGKLFVVLLTEKINGKQFLIYLDETGWAPTPTREDKSFIQNMHSLPKNGTITKKGKMVMHYKQVK